MKVIAFLLTLLIPGYFVPGTGVAHAQVGPEVYKNATPGQVFPYDNVQRDISRAVVHQMVYLLCSTACYVWPYAGVTNNGLPGTLITQGFFLPASAGRIFSVTRGSSISVIRNSSSGELHIEELTK